MADESLTAAVGPELVRRVRRLWMQARDGAILMARSVWGGIVGVYSSDDLTHAASIAYYALLSFLPFLLLAFSVLGTFAADEEDRTRVLDFVLRHFPTQLEFATAQLDMFRQTRVKIGIGGGVALVWASLGVFGAISSAVNYAWRVERPRSFWGHRLVSFLMMCAAGLLLVVALLLVSAAQIARTSWFAREWAQFPLIQTLTGLGATLAAYFLLVGVVGMVFYVVPNTKVRFRDVWPGALLTGVLWKSALELFSWYVRTSSKVSVHGSIATVVLFLFWVYVSAVILLYGVEFTAFYAKQRRMQAAAPPPAPASDLETVR
jgi:membrane protein